MLLNDEKPQHEVFLNAYWIDQFEVTNEQFTEFVQQTGFVTGAELRGCSYITSADCLPNINWKKPFGSDTTTNENDPVVHINWNDATAYCNWAGRRLPTEAEWEKAARGKNGFRFPWGENWVTDGLANFCDQNCQLKERDASVSDGYTLLAPVGSFPDGASPYGVLDMAGNVLEWVYDLYGESYYRNSSDWVNPTGPTNGTYRGIRGGAWSMEAQFMRTTFRGSVLPGFSNSRRGFRCVMDANQ